jgi:hypothetical protein
MFPRQQDPEQVSVNQGPVKSAPTQQDAPIEQDALVEDHAPPPNYPEVSQLPTMANCHLHCQLPSINFSIGEICIVDVSTRQLVSSFYILPRH